MTNQSSKWHNTRKARMDELFTGKKFTVVEEFKYADAVETPLGYKVNKGYRLRAEDGSADIFVGKALLSQLASDYNAVDKPVAKKRGRPRKQPIEQAEDWASRDIPDDAQEITQAGPTYTNPNADEEA
jgi:hypothetical protein